MKNGNTVDLLENILRAVREYKISIDGMKTFAYALGPNIGGAHSNRMDGKGQCDEHEMKHILSDYYRETMFDILPSDALKKLNSIFKNELKMPDLQLRDVD